MKRRSPLHSLCIHITEHLTGTEVQEEDGMLSSMFVTTWPRRRRRKVCLLHARIPRGQHRKIAGNFLTICIGVNIFRLCASNVLTRLCGAVVGCILHVGVRKTTLSNPTQCVTRVHRVVRFRRPVLIRRHSLVRGGAELFAPSHCRHRPFARTAAGGEEHGHAAAPRRSAGMPRCLLGNRATDLLLPPSANEHMSVSTLARVC